MENVITLKICDKMEVEIDYVYLTIHLRLEHKKHDALLKIVAEQREELIRLFENEKISKEQIKMRKFDISVKYSNSEQGIFTKSNISGYKFVQELVVEFDYDEKLLNHIASALLHSNCNVTTEFDFDKKNKDQIINAMIEHLGEKACQRAEQLLLRTNAKLGILNNVSFNVDFDDLLGVRSTSRVGYHFEEFLSPDYGVLDACGDFFSNSSPSNIVLEIEALYSWNLKE